MTRINPILVPAGIATALAMGLTSMAAAQVSVVAWGRNNAGQCDVPLELGSVVSVHAGYEFAGVVRTDGIVVLWGANDSGQRVVPSDLGPVAQLSLGSRFCVARRLDGSVRCWGSNSSGQCNVPADLPPVQWVKAGATATHVIRAADGLVVGWGFGAGSDNLVPGDLGPCTRVVQGDCMAAIRLDGTVRTWGGNGIFDLAPPADLGQCVDIDSIEDGFVALRSDGRVQVWQDPIIDLSPPPGLPLASKVSGGGWNSVLVTQANGATTSWHGSGFVGWPVPLTALTSLDVANGNDFCVALATTDCDQNGELDILETSTHDCNGNGVIDACDAAGGFVEDCDGNGLGDDCQGRTPVLLASGQAGPIGAGSPQSWVADGAPTPIGNALLRIRARADLAEDYEFLSIRIGDSAPMTVLAGTVNCGFATPWLDVPVPLAVLRAAQEADGTFAVTVAASLAVNPLACPDGSWVELQMSYEAATAADCDANGQLDACEVQSDPNLDANTNGILDACETFLTACEGDVNGSGSVDGADIGDLLSRWGTSNPAADVNADGVVNGADLGLLLQAWGPCTS